MNLILAMWAFTGVMALCSLVNVMGMLLHLPCPPVVLWLCGWTVVAITAAVIVFRVA